MLRDRLILRIAHESALLFVMLVSIRWVPALGRPRKGTA